MGSTTQLDSHEAAAAMVGAPSAGTVSRRIVSPCLVGRERELALLVETVAAAPAFAVVEGEAGIGKSRLVAELMVRLEKSMIEPLSVLRDGRAHNGGASSKAPVIRVMMGRCHRVREPFPLGPMVEAVRSLAASLGDLGYVGLSPLVGALRPLLPEVADQLPPGLEPLRDSVAERHRVFRALAEVLEAAGPALLVIEDAHWADAQTLEFLAYLSETHPPDLAVVLTFRGEEASGDLPAMVARSPSTTTATRIELAPLDRSATAALAGAILDANAMSDEFTTFLHERTGGAPFAVEEMVALLRERGALSWRHGRWEHCTQGSWEVPKAVQRSVRERVARLSPQAQQVIDAAAVCEVSVPDEVIIAVSGLPREAAVSALSDALASRVLVERENGLAFRHTLAAQSVYQALPPLRRRQLHSRAADALEGVVPRPLGQYARHLRHAERLAEWAVAAEEAADQAIELGHDAEAVRLLRDVLRHAPLSPDQRGPVAVKLGRAAHETLQSSPALIEALSAVLERQPPGPVRGELAFWTSTAIQDVDGGDHHRKRQLLHQAVEDLDDRPELQAWAMVGLGLPTAPAVPLAEHTMWLTRVRKVLPKIADRTLEVYLLGKVAMALIGVGDPAWRSVTAQVEQRIGAALRNRREVHTSLSVGMAACYVGDYPTAQRMLPTAIDGARALENATLERMTRAELALLDCCRGAWDGLAERVEGLIDELADVPFMRIDVEVAAGVLTLAHGDLESAQSRLTAVWQRLEVGEFHLMALAAGALGRLALAHGADGAVDDALARVRRLMAAVQAKEMWAPLPRVLPTATQLLIAADQEAEARTLVARCAQELDRIDAPLAAAALCHARGFLDAAAQEWSAAADNFLAAAQRYEALQSPYEAAQAQEQAGSALFAADDARAEEAVRGALAIYQRLEASWDAKRCARVARSHGVRLPVAYRGGRKGYGETLSPQQRKVAELAALGYSNKEIGDELFLAPSTVNKHLGRAMRKLAVRSRAAVAARLEDRATGQGEDRAPGPESATTHLVAAITGSARATQTLWRRPH